MKKSYNLNRKTLCWMLTFIMAGFFMVGDAPALLKKKKLAGDQREDIRQMAAQTLDRLYKIKPEAKEAIEKSAGYGVFSDASLKILVAGGGRGAGVVMDNTTKEETFMKMVEIQAGLGVGIKKFRVIFAFENQEVLNNFIESGWQFGGQATAAAKGEERGGAFAGAFSVSPGIWLYQLTDKGLALEVGIKGTKYYKDKTLN